MGLILNKKNKFYSVNNRLELFINVKIQTFKQRNQDTVVPGLSVCFAFTRSVEAVVQIPVTVITFWMRILEKGNKNWSVPKEGSSVDCSIWHSFRSFPYSQTCSDHKKLSLNEWMNEWMKALFSLVIQLLYMRTYCF